MAQVMPSFHWDGRWWSVITFHSETMNSKAQPSVVVLGEPNYSLCIYPVESLEPRGHIKVTVFAALSTVWQPRRNCSHSSWFFPPFWTVCSKWLCNEGWFCLPPASRVWESSFNPVHKGEEKRARWQTLGLVSGELYLHWSLTPCLCLTYVTMISVTESDPVTKSHPSVEKHSSTFNLVINAIFPDFTAATEKEIPAWHSIGTLGWGKRAGRFPLLPLWLGSHTCLFSKPTDNSQQADDHKWVSKGLLGTQGTYIAIYQMGPEIWKN